MLEEKKRKERMEKQENQKTRRNRVRHDQRDKDVDNVQRTAGTQIHVGLFLLSLSTLLATSSYTSSCWLARRLARRRKETDAHTNRVMWCVLDVMSDGIRMACSYQPMVLSFLASWSFGGQFGAPRRTRGKRWGRLGPEQRPVLPVNACMQTIIP